MVYEVFSFVLLLELELLYIRVNVKLHKIGGSILNRLFKNLVHNSKKV